MRRRALGALRLLQCLLNCPEGGLLRCFELELDDICIQLCKSFRFVVYLLLPLRHASHRGLSEGVRRGIAAPPLVLRRDLLNHGRLNRRRCRLNRSRLRCGFHLGFAVSLAL